MANPEHLAILELGVETWNQWREEYPEIMPDLSGATLKQENLSLVNFGLTNLRDTTLFGANLRMATLIGADLSRAILVSANLSQATLHWANLNQAGMHATVLSDVDLRNVEGLETVIHLGPSTIGIDTLYNSGGKIPEAFLRGCGVPEHFIAYIPSLVGQAIQYYSCFISYSSKDQAFAERLHVDLQGKGVRCWFAPEDMKIGDRFRVRIDDSIHVHEKLLLILSENSVASDWVEKEVETAMEKERENKKTVLFPVRLDDSVNAIRSGWAADIRRARHIGDFSKWKNHDEYRNGFERLLRDLKIESSADGAA